METWAPSLSKIDAVAGVVSTPMPPAIGFSVAMTVSAGSTSESSTTATVKVTEDWPAGIVTVEGGGVKSEPDVAVPLYVIEIGVGLVGFTADVETVNVMFGPPSMPF